MPEEGVEAVVVPHSPNIFSKFFVTKTLIKFVLNCIHRAIDIRPGDVVFVLFSSGIDTTVVKVDAGVAPS